MEAAQVFIANFGKMLPIVQPRRRIRPDYGDLDVIVVRASGPLPGLMASSEAILQQDLGSTRAAASSGPGARDPHRDEADPARRGRLPLGGPDAPCRHGPAQGPAGDRAKELSGRAATLHSGDTMRYLLAILLPPIGMLSVGKPFQALLCLVLMFTILGWPFASIGGPGGARPVCRSTDRTDDPGPARGAKRPLMAGPLHAAGGGAGRPVGRGRPGPRRERLLLPRPGPAGRGLRARDHRLLRHARRRSSLHDSHQR